MRERRCCQSNGCTFTKYAGFNVDQVLASKSDGASASEPECQKGDLIQEDDLQDAMNVLKAKGDNDTKYNCCGGGITECGPLLVQNGTASISLCGSME